MIATHPKKTNSRPVIQAVRETLASFPEFTIHHDPEPTASNSGQFRPLSESNLHPSVVAFLRQRYGAGFFTHQHHAIESVLAGHNTVVATRTSSGKSLIFSLPVFDALCRDPQATSLLIYPQKALANDQLLKLQDMASEIDPVTDLTARKPRLISRYDGSTPGDDRPEIRRDVQILLTNPDMLHLGIMQHHEQLWSRFFANLRLVTVDECHEYRGVFGTNVAYILRRLRQTTKGTNPSGIHIPVSDIAIIYVESRDFQATAFEIGVGNDGEFLQPWPDSFFDQDYQERFG